jgi:hypothetical protein
MIIDPVFFIRKSDFRIFLPEVDFDETIEKGGEDAHNSRRIRGVMSTASEDRQGETVFAKGLDFNPFLHHGHFNDNHSQSTAGVVGYPERALYSEEIKVKKGGTTQGWLTEGYILKGTQRADDIWELAKALAKTPDRRLGMSIEGKILRRKNNCIEKALIRNVAITNCPVNAECTWDVLAKSFYNQDIAMKALSAGYATAPATQSGGGALRPESLEKDKEKRAKRDKGLKTVMRSFGYFDPEELIKAFDLVLECRPDFTDEAAAEVVKHLFTNRR